METIPAEQYSLLTICRNSEFNDWCEKGMRVTKSKAGGFGTVYYTMYEILDRATSNSAAVEYYDQRGAVGITLPADALEVRSEGIPWRRTTWS